MATTSELVKRAASWLLGRRTHRGWWAQLLWGLLYVAVAHFGIAVGMGGTVPFGDPAWVLILGPAAIIVVQWMRPTVVGWLLVPLPALGVIAYTLPSRLSYIAQQHMTAGDGLRSLTSDGVVVVLAVATLAASWPGRLTENAPA